MLRQGGRCAGVGAGASASGTTPHPAPRSVAVRAAPRRGDGSSGSGSGSGSGKARRVARPDKPARAPPRRPRVPKPEQAPMGWPTPISDGTEEMAAMME
jgi:hypothetical protein